MCIRDSYIGLQIASGEVILDARKAVRARQRVRSRSGRRRRAVTAERAAVFAVWRDVAMAAAVDTHSAAVVENIGAGRDVDEADGAHPEFGRKRARHQGDAADKIGIKNACLLYTSRCV